jgi:hypothetical protein
MNNNDIYFVNIHKVHRKYVPAAYGFVLDGYCEIVKNGPWPSLDTQYSYGDELNWN